MDHGYCMNCEEPINADNDEQVCGGCGEAGCEDCLEQRDDGLWTCHDCQVTARENAAIRRITGERTPL